MSKDYANTIDRLAPGTANPEVAVNDAYGQIETALTEVAAGAGSGGGDGLPTGGEPGQVLTRLDPTGADWRDVPAGDGGGSGPTGYGSHRYWRVFMRPGSGYYAYAIAALVFLDASGAAIAVSGGTYLDGNPGRTDNNTPDKAFDGDASTFWQGKGESDEMVKTPTFLGYVFPTGVAVAGIKISARNGGGSAERQVPNDMVLQFSDDGKAWIGALSFGGNTDFTPAETRTYKSIYSV